MNENPKINWYRSKVDKALLSELMRKSDARGFAQVIPQLLLFALTGTLSYLAFRNLRADNWSWALPLLLLALFVHGTVGYFFGGIAGHELSHKTPFASAGLNAFFQKIYAFLAWFDPAGFRASHIRHHQVTAHAELDAEVVLPQGLNWHGVWFVVTALTIDPAALARQIRFWVAAACGSLSQDGFLSAAWLQRVVPASNEPARREIRNWARIVVLGHLALAALFVATGHWFLIVVFTLGCQYCSWLEKLCGAAQHVGLAPNARDYRLNTRTFTCGPLPAFLYWNMQYHVEHHMYPAVPFYNLPRLHEAIKHDLPPTPHGLWATWRELIPIMRRQRLDPSYVHVPVLPRPASDADRVSDEVIQSEAAGASGHA